MKLYYVFLWTIRIIVLSVLLAILICLANRCCTEQRCNQKYPPQITEKHDTLIKTTQKDSLIKLPADSSWLKALIECRNNKPLLISTQTGNSGDNSPQISYMIKDSLIKIEAKVR